MKFAVTPLVLTPFVPVRHIRAQLSETYSSLASPPSRGVIIEVGEIRLETSSRFVGSIKKVTGLNLLVYA